MVHGLWNAVNKETRQDADFEHREDLGSFEKLSPILGKSIHCFFL